MAECPASITHHYIIVLTQTSRSSCIAVLQADKDELLDSPFHALSGCLPYLMCLSPTSCHPPWSWTHLPASQPTDLTPDLSPTRTLPCGGPAEISKHLPQTPPFL